MKEESEMKRWWERGSSTPDSGSPEKKRIFPKLETGDSRISQGVRDSNDSAESVY